MKRDKLGGFSRAVPSKKPERHIAVALVQLTPGSVPVPSAKVALLWGSSLTEWIKNKMFQGFCFTIYTESINVLVEVCCSILGAILTLGNRGAKGVLWRFIEPLF
jgi:hypothetical protein